MILTIAAGIILGAICVALIVVGVLATATGFETEDRLTLNSGVVLLLIGLSPALYVLWRMAAL